MASDNRSSRKQDRSTVKPILFSAPMVRALLDGRKTQTRRVIALPRWASTDPADIEFGASGAPEVICRDTGCFAAVPMRFAIGDRLWVRETWQLHTRAADLCTVVYRASINDSWTEAHEQFADSLAVDMQPRPFQSGWASSIHMPRWASRLALTVMDVRVQRLQDISEEDAQAEGCDLLEEQARENKDLSARSGNWALRTAYGNFLRLWCELHGGLSAWDANPWVAAISFTVASHKVDAATLSTEMAP